MARNGICNRSTRINAGAKCEMAHTLKLMFREDRGYDWLLQKSLLTTQASLREAIVFYLYVYDRSLLCELVFVLLLRIRNSVCDHCEAYLVPIYTNSVLPMTYDPMYLSTPTWSLHILCADLYDSMCIVVFAWNTFDGFVLVLASNRDEFYSRPTQALGCIGNVNSHDIIGGKDLIGGGTWLGVRALYFDK